LKKKLSQEIKIRKVGFKDAKLISGLLKELGYPNPSSFAKDKILKLVKSKNNFVLVAEVNSEVIGVTHLHIAELFHEAGKLGRIMALVVNKKYRQAGVGHRLMLSLETIARKKGCTKIEITSALHRKDAHKFYQGLGYFEKPKRFIKILDI
jgi:N-acetylglutamate synthase-like GNAT family acetyltransferase